MATMSGVLMGSLWTLWPWKMISSIMAKSTGEEVSYQKVSPPDKEMYKILSEEPLWPSAYAQHGDPEIFAVVLSALLGVGLIFLIYALDRTQKAA